MKDIAIYGTGVWGNRIYGYLIELGVEISCFMKTTAGIDETFKDLPVLSAEKVLK